MTPTARLNRKTDRMRYVVGFAFNESETKVLLIAKNRAPEGANMKGTFNGLGGKVRHRESYTDAMTREFHQEAGTIVNFWDLFAIMEGDDWRLFCYRTILDHLTWRRIKTLGASPTDEMTVKVPVRKVVTENAKRVVDPEKLPSSIPSQTFVQIVEEPAFYHDVPQLVSIALNPELWRQRALHIDRRSL